MKRFNNLVAFEIGLLLPLLMVLVVGCAHDWTRTEKVMFGAVCAAQIADGIATQNHLNDNPNNYIYDEWAWKYGSNRPSDGALWAVKAAEVGIVYVIASMLPHDHRKVFLGAGAGGIAKYAIRTASD